MASIRGRKYHRRFPDSNSSPRPDLCETRRVEAHDRQEAYDKLTPEQKLQRLDDKLGAGVGAAKQRARLQKALEDALAKREVSPSRSKKDAPAASKKEERARR